MAANSITPDAIILKAYKTGQVLHRQDLKEAAKKYSAPFLTLHRATLRQVLYDEAIDRGVTIRHGIKIDVTGVDLAAGNLKLADTSETIHADLFIGADGGESVVRTALLGHKPKPVPHGKIVHRILIQEKDILARPHLRYLLEQPNVIVWLGPECEAVTYGLDGVFNVAFTWPYSKDPEDIFFGAQTVDLDEFRTQLVDWEPDLREILSLGTSALRWQFFEPVADDDNAAWVDGTGKFCIVGDAAHRGLPYLGQGAAAGVESVSTLAQLLGKARNQDEVREGLGIYQRLRKERTGHVIRATLKTGELWQMADGPLKDERDRQFLHETPTVGYPNPLADPFFQEWLWGFDATKTSDEAWEAHRNERRS
ncbi:putative salicylate hydroxylase [Rosellinia necatrix]|uniref:Putative salicylate hydroxylase n=1 Tax=Rosellinia necatrix TaxID=77044 RepID=A0A1S8ABJ7_ROSNE|nr:putative salicylate hydroxylase [Rosellinia necatrix]